MKMVAILLGGTGSIIVSKDQTVSDCGWEWVIGAKGSPSQVSGKGAND